MSKKYSSLNGSPLDRDNDPNRNNKDDIIFEQDSDSFNNDVFQPQASLDDMESLEYDEGALDDEGTDYEGTLNDAVSNETTDVNSPLASIIKEPRGTLKAAFFNMTNSIVGAGIVGIPMAFRSMGFFSGVLLLMVLAAVNDWTLRLIILNTKLSGGKTVGFAVIIGDSIPHVLRSLFSDAVDDSKILDFLFSRNPVIVFCITFISYPLSLTRDISKLAKASGLALISMLVIITIVLVRGPSVSGSMRGSIKGSAWFLQPDIFQGISVISFAMVCHHNTTFIYDSIRKPTLDRFNAVTHLSCIVSTILCALLGISGYLIFGNKTKGNILNNFPTNDSAINVARFCFGLNMLTTFPLEIYVVREVFKQLIAIYHDESVDGTESDSVSLKDLTTFQHFVITSIVSFLPMIISLFTCNLGAVLELVGATSGSIIAYIFPPLCYDKMTKFGKSKLKRAPLMICVVFGFVLMIVSSTQTIADSLTGKHGNHCVE
ncbi:hypothetical protein HII13_002158 [Brettanomyces bruxellensis]|nr:hypothetical protein HII13_002158 [Brettanomyces bruxellensis]